MLGSEEPSQSGYLTLASDGAMQMRHFDGMTHEVQPHSDIVGEFGFHARNTANSGSKRAGFLNSPTLSSDHRLPWSCGVVRLQRMTFQSGVNCLN